MNTPTPDQLIARPELALLSILSPLVELSITTISAYLPDEHDTPRCSSRNLLPVLTELHLRLAEFHHLASNEPIEPTDFELPF